MRGAPCGTQAPRPPWVCWSTVRKTLAWNSSRGKKKPPCRLLRVACMDTVCNSELIISVKGCSAECQNFCLYSYLSHAVLATTFSMFVFTLQISKTTTKNFRKQTNKPKEKQNKVQFTDSANSLPVSFQYRSCTWQRFFFFFSGYTSNYKSVGTNAVDPK